MAPELDPTLQTYFHAAIQLALPDREVFLSDLAQKDAALAERLEAVLKQMEQAEVPDRTPPFEVLFAGRYRLLHKLGEGGFGVVFKAWDQQLDRHVAIKMLFQTKADKDFLAALEREAKMVALLQHANIVTVFGFERDHAPPFLVMAYIDGETLEAVIDREGVDWPLFLKWSTQLVSALQEAHRRKLVHRDLKPSNLMIDQHQNLIVLDFGLAKSFEKSTGKTASEISRNLEKEGAVVGTISYMAPEQLRGGKVDFRVDIYAIGVLLFQMITGTKPHESNNPVDIISAILRDIPPPVHIQARIDCPAHLSRIVARCLQKNPADRFHTTQDLLEALNFLEFVDPDDESELPDFERSRRGFSRRQWLGLSLLGVGGLGVLRWLKVWPFQKNTPDVVRSYSVMDGGSEPHLVEWSTFFGQMIRRQVIEHVHAPVWISSEGYDSCAQFLAERKADLVLETTFRQGPDQFWLLVRLFNGQEPQRTPLSLEFGLLENPVPSMEQALARIHDFLFPNNFEGGPKPITLLLTNSWPALQAYFRAQLAEQNGAIEDAESLFSESLANGPFSAAYLGLADCQLRLGKWKSALDATSAAFATRYKTASDHQRWSAEGQYFLATGQFENARAVYAKAVEAYPDLPHYREQLAQAFWGQTQYKLALGAFRAGGKYNLPDPNPAYPIYQAVAEDADEAWALATKWQVNEPQEPAHWFARGVTALIAKKYGDAADAFSAFRTECGYRGDPGGIFKAVFFRAKALACQGDLPGALEVLEAFLPQAYPELGAHVAQRNLARAALYLQLKKVSKARPLLEQLLDLDPIPAYLDCFLLASILCDRALSPDLFRQFGEKVQYIHEQYTSLHSSGARALADALRLLWNPHATEKPEVRQDIDDFLGEAVVGYPGPLSQYVLWQWNKRKDTSAVKALDARYWNEWRAPLLLQFFPYPFLAG